LSMAGLRIGVRWSEAGRSVDDEQPGAAVGAGTVRLRPVRHLVAHTGFEGVAVAGCQVTRVSMGINGFLRIESLVAIYELVTELLE
jgi:hypothetical protein